MKKIEDCLKQLDLLNQLHDMWSIKTIGLKVGFDKLSFFEKNDIRIQQTEAKLEIIKIKKAIKKISNQLNEIISEQIIIYEQ